MITMPFYRRSQIAVVLGLLALPLQAGAVVNSLTITEKAGVTTANYPIQIGRPFMQGEISGAPQAVVGGVSVPTQVDIKQRWPDGSVKHAILSFLITPLSANSSVTVTFQNQATSGNSPLLTKTQMLDPAFDFDAQMTLTGGVAATPSAKAMLQAWDGVTDSDVGPAKLWTKGPIATTIILADHTTAHKYDVGPNGSFRPIFQATFWPGIHKVRVRFTGEIANTEALQDLSYSLSLSLGNITPATVYSVAGLTHYAMSRWTRSMSLGAPGDKLPADTEFWIGGAPTAIAIDHNIAYVEQTRFTFNFDPTKTVSAGAMASEYGLWQAAFRDLFGAGLWQKAMGTAGGRPDIGPYPSWTVRWLFTGDPRMKEMALGSAELAAAWPMHFREGNPSKTLDLAGAVPGVGRVLSIRHRPTITFAGAGLAYGYTVPADRVTPIGVTTNGGWAPECAHQPEPWSTPYILTGDYWYLEELWFWAAFAAGYPNGAAYSYAYGRGPTGAEGGLYSEEIRAEAWMLRTRATTAFVSPDGSPEKTYFTDLTNEAIAIEEGAHDIPGTSFEGTPNWTWGHTLRRTAYATNAGQLPPLHQWVGGDSSFAQASYGLDITVTQTASSLFEQNFMLLALGRAKELGFATNALLTYLAAFQTGALTDPGYNHYLISNGRVPDSQISDGKYFPTFTELKKGYDSTWQPLAAFDLTDAEHGYPFIATTATSMVAAESNGPAAWNFMALHALAAPILNDNPKWAVIPRAAVAPPPPSAPLISLQPQSLSVVAGADAMLKCGATGQPPPSCQWQMQPPASVGFSNVPGQTAFLYTRTSVVIADSGAQFRCMATNSQGSVPSNPATLTVTSPPPPNIPVINSASGVLGTAGQPFSYQITATNSPASFTASGLPTGLSLNAATGLISGTPTASGTSNITLTAANASWTSNPFFLVLTINAAPLPPALSLDKTALSYNATAGGSNPADHTLAVSNSGAGNLNWTAAATKTWLTLSPIIGTNAGTVTVSVNILGLLAGTYNDTITFGGNGGIKTLTVTLTVNAPPPPTVPVINSAAGASGTVGQPFSYQITATNSPLSFSAPGLPAGLTLNAASGRISGTPTASGSSNVFLNASNGSGLSSPFLLILTLFAAPLPPTLSLDKTALSYNATAGGSNPAGHTLAVSNSGAGTLNWTAANFKTWLGLSPASGTDARTVTVSVNITGLAAGTYSDTILFGGNGGIKTVAVTLTVNAATPPAIRTFQAYPGSVRKGLVSTISWTVSGATKLMIDQGVGDVTTKNSVDVTPSTATVYTLTATNSMGSVTSAAQVAVTLLAQARQQWPRAVSITGTLSLDYDMSIPGVTFLWTFTPVTRSGSIGEISAPSLFAAPNSKSIQTVRPLVELGTTGLAPGTYLVSVVAQDAQGPSDPITGTVTLVIGDFGTTRVYPNPWRQDKHRGKPYITFDGMPLGSTVKLFTISGHHIKTLTPAVDTLTWDLTNDSGDKVASGIYLYLIDADGQKVRGKLAVIK